MKMTTKPKEDDHTNTTYRQQDVEEDPYCRELSDRLSANDNGYGCTTQRAGKLFASHNNDGTASLQTTMKPQR